MTTRALTFYRTTIGKKVVMAVSGLIGFGFLLGHMAGNLLTFVGPETYNAYAAALKGNPALLWGTRITLLAAIVAHTVSAIALVQRNNQARRYAYGNKQDIATSYAAKTMKYGGVWLLLFIVYHLLHLTGGWTEPLGYQFDPENVYNNLVLGFQNRFIALFYLLSMSALGMHLYHGLWSLTQSLGLDHPRYNTLRENAALAGTLVIILGFITVPLSVMTGSLEPVDAGDIVADAELAE